MGDIDLQQTIQSGVYYSASDFTSFIESAIVKDSSITADNISSNSITTLKVVDKAITLSKQADVSTGVIMGRLTAGTGSQEALNPMQAKTILSLENVSNISQLPASYLDTDGTLSANSDTKVPSQKAVKEYADTKAASGANSDITSISGLTTALSIAQGGTGATSASAARTNFGVIADSDKPIFNASLSTDSYSIPGDSVFRKIPLGIENIDTHDYFDSVTNYRFTPLKSGYYCISGHAYVDVMKVGAAQLTIRKNGSSYVASSTETNQYGTVQKNLHTPATEIYLNGTTDYVELWISNTTGSAFTLSYEPYNTFMSGHFIRS